MRLQPPAAAAAAAAALSAASPRQARRLSALACASALPAGRLQSTASLGRTVACFAQSRRHSAHQSPPQTRQGRWGKEGATSQPAAARPGQTKPGQPASQSGGALPVRYLCVTSALLSALRSALLRFARGFLQIHVPELTTSKMLRFEPSKSMSPRKFEGSLLQNGVTHYVTH